MTALLAPFPYFGGKRLAAPLIWDALGDPPGYIEPFAGSAAVLLARPPSRHRSETINDADGWLVNAWRAIRSCPERVADAAWGPVTEIDYHARLAWLQERRTPDLVAWLEGDPEVCDPKAAGWWLYVTSCAIGDPWDPGPWHVVDGRLTKAGQGGIKRELPHLAADGRGIKRELPHLAADGQGVQRKLPHLGGDDGRGVHRERDQAGLTHLMRTLAARLTDVRITCGDWQRVLTPSILRTSRGPAAIFLDPPYSTSGDLYAHGDTGGDLAAAVQLWCLTAPDGHRIVLAGYDADHDVLLSHGWEKTPWKAKGGYGRDKTQRENLWLSPACHQQPHLF